MVLTGVESTPQYQFGVLLRGGAEVKTASSKPREAELTTKSITTDAKGCVAERAVSPEQ